MIDEFLKSRGLKYEDLNYLERETLNSWMASLQQGTLSVDKIKEYIQAMRDAVETELAKMENNSKQDTFLKARLRNYMLLEAFLSTPEKAKQRIQAALAMG